MTRQERQRRLHDIAWVVELASGEESAVAPVLMGVLRLGVTAVVPIHQTTHHC